MGFHKFIVSSATTTVIYICLLVFYTVSSNNSRYTLPCCPYCAVLNRWVQILVFCTRMAATLLCRSSYLIVDYSDFLPSCTVFSHWLDVVEWYSSLSFIPRFQAFVLLCFAYLHTYYFSTAPLCWTLFSMRPCRTPGDLRVPLPAEMLTLRLEFWRWSSSSLENLTFALGYLEAAPNLCQRNIKIVC